MCGIVGYAGDIQAAPILLDGLARLEYRGYDSAGIAVAGRSEGRTADGTGTLEVVKAKGRLKVLCEMTDNGRAVAGTCGIGHTRWATHGEPSVANSHPHCAGDKRVVVVHNGIIENFQEIKDKLQKDGVEFISQTDTEVLAHLLDKYYNGNPIETISKMMVRIRGSYALGILFKDRPGEIYAVRKDSPLIAGRSDCGNFIASDVPAILKYTRDICFVKNMEILSMTKEGIRLYNIDQDELETEFSRIDWDTEAAEKNGFEHFMLKEIHEQPKAVRDTLNPRIKDKQILLDELKLTDEEICGLKRIQMVACGSAYHVCMSAKYIFEQLARIPVDVDLASEMRYRNPVFEDHTLAIVVSQSGETADTLAALREARNQGLPVMGIVNVVGSSIAREADHVFYTWAGPEIAVATTKAYSAQLAAVYLLAIHFGRVRGNIDDRTYQCMEGSLKLKEISYMHSEAYAAGELKHGTISLIEDGIWTIGIATQGSLFEKLISNMVEVKSRGANILGITSYGNYSMEDTADCTIYVPKTLECFYPSLVVIPLQLLAYYVSLSKGLDVDKPRNLAKSVTVE